MRPNLIVAGVQKCGTSSFCEFLASHSDFLMSNPKETRFFSQISNLSDPSHYDNFYRHGEGKSWHYIVDGSVEYAVNAYAPYFIRCMLDSGTKIIFLIRAPVMRAYSGYIHLYKRGEDLRRPEEVFLDLGSDCVKARVEETRRFASALADGRVDISRVRARYDDPIWPFLYIKQSFYSRHIAPYRDVFGKENILVLLFEDMIHDGGRIREQVAKFLGVSASTFPESFRHLNRSVLPEAAQKPKWRLRSLVGRSTPQIPKVALKPSAEICEALNDIFEEERAYWIAELGRDLRVQGW